MTIGATEAAAPLLPARFWRLRTRAVDWCQGPVWMGIVNVTAESFSDGGRFLDPARAVEQALRLAEAGAGILDIGGESTRPYAVPIDVETEQARVIPVIRRLAPCTRVPISIDTSKAAVARAALDAGAEIINDVTGLRGDVEMAAVARAHQAGVCVMHMQGTPQTMQDHPRYGDVVEEIAAFLAQRVTELADGGVEIERIAIDPGIGFGKTHEHNWALLRRAKRFLSLGRPVVIGHSRKGFIGKAIGSQAVGDRDLGTAILSGRLAREGIPILRVHDVALNRRLVEFGRAIDQSPEFPAASDSTGSA